jgi:hypothetical protein
VYNRGRRFSHNGQEKEGFQKCMIYRVALPKFYIFHHSEDKSKCHKKRNIYPCGTYDANFPSLNPKAFILN